jgi:NADH dehydrogenase/NADH:ubiquinone oxidoreductase subunit G
MANRAGFPPGEAKEDWAILRALSAELGQTLPFDSLAALRAKLYEAHPHLAAIDQVPANEWARVEAGGLEADVAFAPGDRPLPDQPDPARQRSDGGAEPPRRGARAAHGRGVSVMPLRTEPNDDARARRGAADRDRRRAC